MTSTMAKAVFCTILALAASACANRAASGVSPIQPNAAAAESSARNPFPSPTGGAPSTRADAGVDAGAATRELNAPAEPQSPSAEQSEPAASNPELLPWLVGRWKGKRKTCWPITWSQPDEIQSSRQNRCNEAGVVFSLELTFTESPGKLDGLLEAVAPSGRRHNVVGFVIARNKASCSLVWTEGGMRYGFSFESASSRNTCFEGQIARFSLKRGPTSRTPYPIDIQFWIQDRELQLRRVHGPQHGAAVDVIYSFER